MPNTYCSIKMKAPSDFTTTFFWYFDYDDTVKLELEETHHVCIYFYPRESAYQPKLIVYSEQFGVVSPTEKNNCWILFQNYPNPFRSRTTISVQIPEEISRNSEVRGEIQIHDLVGRVVRTLSITNYQLPITRITWDGRDESGNRVPRGIYFYKLQVGGYTAIKKMCLVR